MLPFEHLFASIAKEGNWVRGKPAGDQMSCIISHSMSDGVLDFFKILDGSARHFELNFWSIGDLPDVPNIINLENRSADVLDS